MNGLIPYPDVATKFALSVGVGLLVGLEREWAQKEIGVRTFSIVALFGTLATFISPAFGIVALIGTFLLIIFLNVQSLARDLSLELTTSAALLVVVALGILIGLGHYFTSATGAILVTMLLAWKVELARFADALKPEEIRGAVLLGLLSFVVYPLLPDRFVDPWQLVNPRQAWVIVLVIAGIGFVNYVLLRLYSARGLYYAAILGGLVNSTAAVVELAGAFRRAGQPNQNRLAGLVLLTNLAMFVRNLLILGIFAPLAVKSAIFPMIVMTLATTVLCLDRMPLQDHTGMPLILSSPVSLRRVLKFAALFIALAAIGTLAQRHLGNSGFLAVSVVGGLVSSASTTASAAALAASGHLSPRTAGMATVLTSVASAVVNLPLVHQQTRSVVLTRRIAISTVTIAALGLLVMFLPRWLF